MLDSLAAWSSGDRVRGKAGMEERQGRPMMLDPAQAAQGRCEGNGPKRAGKSTHGGQRDNTMARK